MDKGIRIARIARMISVAIVFLLAIIGLLGNCGLVSLSAAFIQARGIAFVACLLVLAVSSIVISRQTNNKQQQ